MRTKIILTTTLLAALLAAVAAARPDGRRGEGPLHLGGPPWETLAADYDQDEDGQITMEEFGGAEGTFEHFDRDGDGVLTEEDFPRTRIRKYFGGRLVLAADADEDGAVTTAEWTGFLTALDADADGVISRDEIRSHFHRPDAARDERPRRHGPWGEGEHPLDSDDDGAVEVSDFNLIFAKFDDDGDGTVTAEELPVWRHRRRF